MEKRFRQLTMFVAAGSAAVLLWLIVAAATGWSVTPRSILNWAGICGTLLAAASLLRSSAAGNRAWISSLSHPRLFLLLALILTTVCFVRVLSLGFLSDDFVQTRIADTMRLSDLAALFYKPTAGVFFRPLEYGFLRFVGLWAGFDPLLWHAVNLVLHLANCVLVYFIVSKLRVGAWVPAITALLFGVHGSRPEAVAWANGRLGLFAGFLVLAALLTYLKYCERKRAGYLMGSLLLFAAALLAKESAYSLPVLLLVIAGFRKEPQFRLPRIHLLYWALALVIFAYRWLLLGGIGGYTSPGSGSFPGLVFGAVKVFMWRLWAVLFFPVNWSVPVQPYLMLSLALYIGALVWMSTAQKGKRSTAFSLAFAVAASLPAVSLLLIGPSMEGSRLLYIPALGYCLWVGVSLEEMRKRWMCIVILIVIAGFHCAALAHNLAVWQRVSTLAAQVCTDTASVGPEERSIVAVGLPRSIDGVLFLENGFPECVRMHARRSFDSIEAVGNIDQVSPEQASAVFVWNNSRRRLERIR